MSGLETKKDSTKNEEKEHRPFFAMRGFKVFVIITVLGSFILNIHTAFVSSNLDTLRFLIVSGFALAALWFLLYLAVDAANTRLHKEMHLLLRAHGEYIESVLETIEGAAKAQEEDAKAAAAQKAVKTPAEKKASAKKQPAKKKTSSKVISDIKE